MSTDDWKDALPWRPNVGICLINPQGLIWIGKGEDSGPELVSPGREWQMPQGGIDGDEDVVEAARRELFEETGTRSAEFLAMTEDWWAYDFPVQSPDPAHKLAPFRGQKQKWVAFRFTGSDTEFDVSADHVHEPAEFLEWKWATPEEVLDRVVDFKRAQYVRVIDAFRKWTAAPTDCPTPF